MTSSSNVVIAGVQLAAGAFKLDKISEEEQKKIEQVELSALRQKAAVEKQQAFERGFREGQQKAEQKAAAHLTAENQRWAGLLQQLASARREALQQAEGQLIELVLKATEKIISTRPPSPETISAALREALSLLLTKDKLTIVCAPADGAYLREFLSTHREEFEDLAKFTIREDASISSGGCLVETEWGTVDARVEKQLAILKRIWRDAVDQKPNEDQPIDD